MAVDFTVTPVPVLAGREAAANNSVSGETGAQSKYRLGSRCETYARN